MYALFLTAIASQGNNGIWIFADIHARADHTGLKCLPEIIIYNSGMLL